MTFTVFRYDGGSFFIGQILDALLRTQMELHPYTSTVSIYQTISMTAETMHVTIRRRNTTVGHYNRDLM